MTFYMREHASELASSRTPTTPHKQEVWSGRSSSGSRSRRETMDLSYVTERILALWFPPEVGQAAYRQGHQEAAHMLHSKHGTSYMVFNLSEPRRGARREHERVRELGWPSDLAPPLERLCAVCKDLDSWLSADSSRIAVLHARGNRERIGVVVAAYMHYSSICGSPEQALDRFAMKRFLDHKIGDLELPSNRRYVEYFSGLLSGSIRINSAPLYLTHVTVLGAPAFERSIGCGGGGCRAFLKVYEGLIPVYTSGVHTVGGDTRQFTVNIAADRQRRGLQLRGDILLKCYHRHYGSGVEPADPGGTPTGEPTMQRELIFACQFHTCAVSDYTLSFTRQELDLACNDLRFPLDGAVELHFSGRAEGVRQNQPAPTPAVPVDNSHDPVTRWDSYEHLDHPPQLSPPDSDDTEDTNETETGVQSSYEGPLDGSLYARVVKRGGQESDPTAVVGVGGSESGRHRGDVVIASPHTVSMDSGISSAGNGLQRCTEYHGTAQRGGLHHHHNSSSQRDEASPPPPTSELDRLLDDMLMTVRDIPDLGQEIPYHARRDSRPFTYGHLSSPGLVRKATPPRASPAPPPPPTSPDFHEGSIVSGSISQHSSNNLTWLQRQQQKLRERRELQLRWERDTQESRLLSEMRTRASPSRRADGYTSDTTHIDDEDFSLPLHVHTGQAKPGGGSAPVSPLLPHRSSSRRHPAANRHERPFVQVKRAHELSKKYSDTLRDEGYSWRTTSTSEGTGSPGNSPRPQTPAFPVHPRTPYSNNSHAHFDSAGLPPKSPTAQRKEWSPLGEVLLKEREHSTTSSLRGYESSDQHSPKSPGFCGIQNGTLNGGASSPSPTVYYGTSRRSSIHSNSEPPQEVSPAHVKFVRDTSRFWYKPTISREEAIAILRDQSPGTFVVRDSNSFPGAFGLALKVATPPPNAGKSSGGDPANELVRHFLIEPTSRGVRLKGCPNEPVFSSLSALVYQHSLLPLALPCRLVLPEADLSRTNDSTNTLTSAQMLLAQGAACNVLYLTSVDTESLTGPQAIVRATTELFSGPLPIAAVVHFKVSGQGITLTDNKRQLFFRRHYPVASISYCGLDPDDHRWNQKTDTGLPTTSLRCFGFVARKPASKTDNQCHIFAELEPGQPATAIVNFVSKVMMTNNQTKANIV